MMGTTAWVLAHCMSMVHPCLRYYRAMGSRTPHLLTASKARPHLWDALRHVRHDGGEEHLGGVTQQAEEERQGQDHGKLQQHVKGRGDAAAVSRSRQGGQHDACRLVHCGQGFLLHLRTNMF